MARALHRKGDEVSLLALMDVAPARSNGRALEDDDDLALLMDFAQDLGLQVSQESWPRRRLEQLNTGERLSYLHELARTTHFISPDLGLPEVMAFFEIYKRNARAIRAYAPAPHLIKAVLFRSSESLTDDDWEATGGWCGVIGDDLDVHVLPGNHYTIMRRPQVKVLGDKLRELLTRAQEADHTLLSLF